MKALVYEKAHSLADFAIKLVEIAVPTLRDNDVLVDEDLRNEKIQLQGSRTFAGACPPDPGRRPTRHGQSHSHGA